MSEPVPTLGSNRLHVHTPGGPVRGVALVLHGGKVKGHRPVPRASLTVARMLPFDTELRRLGTPRGLAVARLRFTVQGWNGPERSPVHDARRAIRELHEHFGVPVGLIGHSMGGRTALAVADDAAVVSVVGLAPWIEPDDSVEPLRGRRLLVLHGDRDHVTSPAASRRFVERADGVARSASYVSIQGSGHPMLRRPREWHRLSARYTLGALGMGEENSGTTEELTPAQRIVRDALDGVGYIMD